ncbi:MAG: hypothetical protein LBI31_04485 [Zoogloeaceae bacterium]|jgi:hypothetical protein|nr:hypothetical protein [Zoogloeaceae bacterium]
MPLSSLATALISNIVSSILGSIADAPPDDAYTQPVPGYQGEGASVGRVFPAGTAIGVLAGPPVNGMVSINNALLRTAPGLQIRNESNLIVLPVMMKGKNLRVRYQLDNLGNAWRIWILTPAEIAQAGVPPNGSNGSNALPAFLR